MNLAPQVLLHVPMNKLRSWPLPISITCLLIGFSLVACYTVPETGRSAFNVIGPSEEMSMGISAFNEIKRTEKRSTDKNLNAMVQRVGNRVAAAATPDIANAQWEFILFENDKPNAFALPAGKVGIYTGILKITKTDAGLATVLAHEIGHVAAHHGAERMSEQMAIGVAGAGLGVALGKQSQMTQQVAMTAFGLGATGLRVLPHSRDQESEADRIGLIYMAKAGYNPSEAISFWERFRDYNQTNGGSPPEFLSTHPTDQRRIDDLKNKWLPEAKVYYKTSGGK
jgi:metalloendopeptidase OMA1, mitochondrial